MFWSSYVEVYRIFDVFYLLNSIVDYYCFIIVVFFDV